jgi:hypothetical protein
MSNDTINDDHSSSEGNPIDVEWRQAMADLRRQEELDMLRGTYSEYHSSHFIHIIHFSHYAHCLSSLPQIIDFNPLIPINWLLSLIGERVLPENQTRDTSDVEEGGTPN